MKREIKFRGYCQHDNIWFYGDLIQMAENDIRILPFDADDDFNVDPESVGQFTGLCDKNGIEIYEGDIVNIESDLWFMGDYEEEEVYWCGRGFYPWTDASEQINIAFIASTEPKHIEVVGNIYTKQPKI